MTHHVKHILVPVDFHVPSRVALKFAAEIAAPLGASVDVLHVVDLPPTRTVPTEGHVPVPIEYRREVERLAGERLAEWTATTSAPAGAPRAVVDGKPAAEIVRYAAEHGVDLIVIGTTGDGRAAMTGSVADRVVRTAPCPVVTVRGPHEGR
jgi:nucleotide-binding universal stress UspA family protein